jgi:hypothetical protein
MALVRIGFGMALVAMAMSGCKGNDPNKIAGELMERYSALPASEKGGEKGKRVIQELQAMVKNQEMNNQLSMETQEAIARLIAGHNLRQINFRDKQVPKEKGL